MTFYGVD